MLKLVLVLSLAVLAKDYDIVQHGQDCAEHLGMELPEINCLDGDIVPVTSKGKVPEHYAGLEGCDKPAWLPMPDHCVPFARQQVIRKGPVTINVLCRRYKLLKPDDPTFQDVGVIMHNSKTNEVCFFEMLDKQKGKRADKIIPPFQKGRSAEQNEMAKKFWLAPEVTANVNEGLGCTGCHSNDLWMHSPYIDQVKGKNAVPHDLSTKNYKVVGPPFKEKLKQRARPIEIDLSCYDKKFPPTKEEKALIDSDRMAAADKCTECHSLDSKYLTYAIGHAGPTQLTSFGKKFPHSAWMPPDVADYGFQTQEAYDKYFRRAIEAASRCIQTPSLECCSPQPVVDQRQKTLPVIHR